MKKEKMLRAVIFARVASNRNNLEEIHAQRVNCEQYIKERGYELVGVHSLCGASGSAQHKTEMSKLRAGAQAGAFDRIIVVNLARISRRPQEIISFINEMELYGVAVESVREPEGSDLLCQLRNNR